MEQKPQQKPNQVQGAESKHLVRISNTDLLGSKPIYHALRKIKGIGPMYANMICNLINLDKNKKTGILTDAEIEKLNDAIKNPQKYNVPRWMMNRRDDYETGEDKHLVTTDLKFANENDIRRMKKIKSYKGIRHSIGQPVRGQRTKANFRRNKGKTSLGVKKKPTKSGRV
jgi:small subunit ribosomal protein S13